jgi:hypothetical protein
MSTIARPSLLRRLMGLPAPRPEFDPADMGTAMGLDFMLDQPPLEGEPARHGPMDVSPDWMVRNWAS